MCTQEISSITGQWCIQEVNSYFVPVEEIVSCKHTFYCLWHSKIHIRDPLCKFFTGKFFPEKEIMLWLLFSFVKQTFSSTNIVLFVTGNFYLWTEFSTFSYFHCVFGRKSHDAYIKGIIRIIPGSFCTHFLSNAPDCNV